MGYTSDSEGRDVVRVRLGALRNELGSLRKLADAVRDEVARLDLNAPEGIGNGTGAIVHNAGRLRRKNEDALAKVGEVVTAVETAVSELESAGRKAGWLLEVADEDSGRHIAGS